MARELALVVALAACKHAADEPPPVPRDRPPLAQRPFYRVDLAAPPSCTAGAPCEARLVLTALGDYHVNERYPVKLVADPSPEVSVEGPGTWSRDGDKTGTLTVVLRAARPGPAKVSGTFKLSVCTDDNCEIETPTIVFELTAS